MKKTALLIMIITIISKIFGFGREIVLSYFYGASDISDAYLIALTVPSVIFGFVGVGITTGYIPMYSKIEREYGELEGNKYTSNLTNTIILLSTVIFIVGLIFTNPIVKIFASGFSGETLGLAVQFTRMSLVGLYFIGLKSIFSGFLQLKGNYAIPAMIGFPLNIITILAIFIGAKTDNVALIIGTVIANSSQFLFLLPSVYKKGYRHRAILNLKDEHIVNMTHIALPVIIGASVNQINVLVDRTIASGLAVGGISALNYANRLNEFIQGLFVMSIATAIYPLISKMAADNNIKGLKDSVAEAINSIGILVIPATVGAMVFAEPIVELLFGRGAFDSQAVKMTASALFFYSIGMLGFGWRDILSRAFYSLQDTKTPMINAAIAMVLNIILNIVLSRFMGISGLALATSISALFCTVLLFISLRKKIGSFGMKGIVTSFYKVVLASIGMGVVARLLYGILGPVVGDTVSLMGSMVVGGLVYLVLVYILKVEEVDIMIKMVKKKLGKG